MATPGTSGVSLDAHFDILVSWLQKVAENTAKTRDSVEKGGRGAALGGAAADDAKQDARFDRFAKRFEAAIGSQLSTRLAQAQGLANRGFSGTVEGARHDYAMEQLGRQFAAVMMPVMQAATYMANEVEKRMRNMSGGEQNRMMGAIVGGGLGLRFGGPLGGVAGALGGSALMGGGGPGDSMRGGLAGAYLGFRAGGPVGAAAGFVLGATTSSGDWGRLRGEGNNKFKAAIGTGIGFIGDLGYHTLGRGGLGIIGGDNPLDAIRREADERAVREGRRPARPEPRRDVTPYQAAMVGAGDTAFKIQEGVIRATAGEGAEEDGGPLKPVIDAIMLGIDELRKLVGLAGGTPAEPPRPARTD